VAIARDATPEQIDQIEKLLISCSLDEEGVIQVEESIPDLTYIRAEKCIGYLSMNQKNRIESGDSYNQGDIDKELTERLERDKD